MEFHQGAQNKLLRLGTNVDRHTDTHNLHRTHKILKIRQKLKQLYENFLVTDTQQSTLQVT